MSTREESYSGYPLWIVPLTGGPPPEPDTHPNAVRIYADENQDLRSLKSDGTDAPIGGGGSQAGGPVVRGPFSFSFNSPGLLTGLEIGYTPAIGDILLDAWFEIDTAWNGTTPKGDIGLFTGGANSGFFGFAFDVVPMNNPDSENPSGLLDSASAPPPGQVLSLAFLGSLPTFQPRIVPGKFTVASPMKVCVSQDGTNTGADPGSAQGAAKVYIITATPAPFV